MACDKNVKLLPRDYQVMLTLRERGIKLTRKGGLTVSQTTIAEWCDCCRETINRSMKRLKAAGLLGQVENYTRVADKVKRCANTIYLLKDKAYNLMAWMNAVATRKPRMRFQSPPVCDTGATARTNIFKNKGWTSAPDCGQAPDDDYWTAILALPDR